MAEILKGNQETGEKKKPVLDSKQLETSLRGMLKVAEQDTHPMDKMRSSLLDTFVRTLPPEISDELVQMIDKLFETIDPEDFEAMLERVQKVITSFLEKHFTRESLEKFRREVFVREGKFMPLNEIISFGVGGDNIAHIHLAPASLLRPKELLRGVREGLQELARRLEEDPKFKDVSVVTASSWIVAKNPKLLERIHFTVDGPISEQMREEHFQDEVREVWAAHMDRKEFLKQYGDK